ncbi:MAG: 2Fe-2S iron-sulfur cluster binding domain-containing protein [Rhodospirillaceae bacterium]|nr:2Fe-2S iron-sulfur cluster binding domain-containing protein [Rhodospirillales bacterium]
MFSLFKKKAPLSIRLDAEGGEFTAAGGQSLLDAALAAGIPWPHRCKVGSCGVCRCKVVEGSVKPLTDFGYVLSPREIAEGTVLACQSRARTDVVVRLPGK